MKIRKQLSFCKSLLVVLMCMVSYFCGFQHSTLGSKLLSQNDPGKFHTDVEQCSCCLNVSHWVFGILTKELQIQNWGTSVSLYNDWYVEDSESYYLPGESSSTVRDTLKLISVNSHMILLSACRRSMLDHTQEGGLKSDP